MNGRDIFSLRPCVTHEGTHNTLFWSKFYKELVTYLPNVALSVNLEGKDYGSKTSMNAELEC